MRKYLFIGAHPDDCDLLAGGTALLLRDAGHQVKFVSVCNGCCGHYGSTREELIPRRRLETLASARVADIEYDVLDHDDCTLEASIANRMEMVGVIRDYAPDVVVSHRICDYHADHRAVANLVQDSAYLIKVPMFCPDHEIPDNEPAFAFFYDRFIDPRPFRFDAVVDISRVTARKVAMLSCHESQMFEWLAYEKKETVPPPGQRAGFVEEIYMKRNLDQAVAAGRPFKYAEGFEISPYGRTITAAEFQKLMDPK